MLSEPDGRGYLVGTVFYIIVLVYFSTQVACLRTNSCGSFDFVLGGLCAIGFLVPAWIVALMVSRDKGK